MVLIRQFLIIFAIVLFSLFLFTKDIKTVSATYDEDFSYVRNSVYLVKNFRWDQPYITLHPPLMYYLHGWPFLFLTPSTSTDILFISRLAILPVFIGFGILIFLIVKKNVSELAAYFTSALYFFNIEILAHARLVTADFTQAVTIFISVISFYYFLKLPTFRRAIAAGIFLGLAFVSKYSGLLLVPLFLVIFILLIPKTHIQKNFFKFIIIIIIGILIIHLSYFFKETGSIPTSYKVQIIQGIYDHPAVRFALYIFPKAYLKGTDLQIATSQSIWWGYFAGRSYNYGLWYFLGAAFLLKTQIPLLFLIVISVVNFLKKNKFKSLDLILTISIFFFFIYFSFFNKLIIGLRYILMIYPLLFLLIAKVFSFDLKKSKGIINFSFFLVLIVIYISEPFWISPHYLAYANEFIGGAKNSYKYFTDSNLDWNQNTIIFQKYLQIHPEITAVNPRKPTAGIIAVNVNQMNLYYYGDYVWLRNLKKEPIDNVGYTWLIFEIKPSEINFR